VFLSYNCTLCSPVVRESIHSVFLQNAVLKSGMDVGIVNAHEMIAYNELEDEMKLLCENRQMQLMICSNAKLGREPVWMQRRRVSRHSYFLLEKSLPSTYFASLIECYSFRTSSASQAAWQDAPDSPQAIRI
jgi:hypothetical protein